MVHQNNLHLDHYNSHLIGLSRTVSVNSKYPTRSIYYEQLSSEILITLKNEDPHMKLQTVRLILSISIDRLFFNFFQIHFPPSVLSFVLLVAGFSIIFGSDPSEGLSHQPLLRPSQPPVKTLEQPPVEPPQQSPYRPE